MPTLTDLQNKINLLRVLHGGSVYADHDHNDVKDALQLIHDLIASSLVTEDNLSLSDVTTDDVTIAKHGFAPKLPNDVSKFLNGIGLWSAPAGGGGGGGSATYTPTYANPNTAVYDSGWQSGNINTAVDLSGIVGVAVHLCFLNVVVMLSNPHPDTGDTVVEIDVWNGEADWYAANILAWHMLGEDIDLFSDGYSSTCVNAFTSANGKIWVNNYNPDLGPDASHQYRVLIYLTGFM